MYVLVVVALAIFIEFVAADIKIESVVMKPIRIGDIGLNFDMSISNRNSKAKYNFKVSCEKCCVFLQGNETECSSKIVGGAFGDILPDKSKVVTLVWPNLVILNRIGYCDIVVVATRTSSDKVRLSRRIEFNTTYDQTSNAKIFDYIPKKGFISNCSTPDLNPMESCSPINCEVKYMGKRNYFNPKIKLCQPVPECKHSKEEIYDYIENECVIWSQVLTKSDLDKLKSGEFEKYDWESSSVSSPFNDGHHSYPDALLEDEALRKSKTGRKHSLGFTMVNCAIALIISCIFYSILACCISSSLRKSNPKHPKYPKKAQIR